MRTIILCRKPVDCQRNAPSIPATTARIADIQAATAEQRLPGAGGGASPYLNMLDAASARRRFRFVRHTGGTFGNAFAPQGGYMGRMPFFPNQIPVYADDETDIQKQLRGRVDDKGQLKVDMPPAGHPSGFMNTEGFFGSPNGVQGFGAARKPQQIGSPPHR